MINAFASPKRASQARVYSSSNKKESSGKNFFLKLPKVFGLKFMRSVIIILSLIYIVVFTFRSTLFVPAYFIQKIQYDSGSVKQLDDPYLYKAISNRVRAENYYVVKLNKRFILNAIKVKFPMVTDLTIEYKSPGIVKVKVDFDKPDMVVRNQNKKWGVYGDFVYQIYSGNVIGDGVTVLNLPVYASGLDNIDGLFWKQSASELRQQMEYIYKAFPSAQSISYLPGGERTAVVVDKKIIYINNLADITQQLKNLDLLKKYYAGYNSLSEIDLGSLEMDNIIVKK